MRLGICAVLLALTFSSLVAAQTVYAFTGTGTGAIPDGTASPPPAFGSSLVVSFNVTGLPFNVRRVAISFGITHTWIGDVEVVLRAPGGSPSPYILSRVGSTSATNQGDNSDLSGTYTFGDLSTNGDLWAAAATAGPTTAVPAGSYRVSTPGGVPGGGAVANMDPLFAGLTPAQANGTWTLTFRDACLGDVGSVSAAALAIDVGPTITGSTPPTGDVAGGTSIIISGSNFDPSGTVVTIGGVNAAGLVTQTQIQVSSPPHAAGLVNITVTTAYGSYTLLGAFTYTSSGGGGGGGGGDDGGGCTTDEGTGMLTIVGALVMLVAMTRRKLWRSRRPKRSGATPSRAHTIAGPSSER